VSEPSTTSTPADLGTDAEAAPLVVRTVRVVDPGALLGLLPAGPEVTAWVRRGDGLVWWHHNPTTGLARDEVGVPGCGLVCFGSFAFADEPGDSVLVVPEVLVGRRGSTVWVTTIGAGSIPSTPPLRSASQPFAPTGVTFADGALTGPDWERAVADAVTRITAGELEKVVLARDLVATASQELDVRWPLTRLADSYDMCWTFHVDGLLGATPEMLVRRERGLVTSRVLAGTIRRTGDDARDLTLAATLARSSKDLEEHEYAVRSVAEALAPYCSSMNVPESPFVLHLPNVMHLATDVAGVVHDNGGRGDGTTSLDLAAALHPSAAVGGTPTDLATRLITELEGMDRGRYAGPVGWMDASGDGEWGLALRSAEVTGSRVRLFAGCGIVADSDPEAELAEAQAKFVPVRDALGGAPA
jgi:menaquinone-specific isochorismate synthase